MVGEDVRKVLWIKFIQIPIVNMMKLSALKKAQKEVASPGQSSKENVGTRHGCINVCL